jgi:hypothetical protein
LTDKPPAMTRCAIIFRIGAALALLIPGAANSAFAEAHSVDDRYESVNAGPQLSIRDGGFAFYWGLWRTLNLTERQALPDGGHLISKREIRWKTYRCEDHSLARQDGELFYFLDRVDFDRFGRIVPIPEALRSDWLYLSMINFSSTHVLSTGAGASGTFGEVLVDAEHVLLPNAVSVSDAGFFDLSRAPWNERYHPNSWPIFYDERAHKPHSLKQPAAFNSTTHSMNGAISRDRFAMRILWSACPPKNGRADPLEVIALVAPGSQPLDGPSRPGRSDRGMTPLRILEREDWREVPHSLLFKR